MVLQFLAFVQTCQPGSQDHLGSEGGFDKAGKDGAVAYLRGATSSTVSKGTRAKGLPLRVRISVGGGRAGGFAVEVGSIVGVGSRRTQSASLIR